MFRGVFLSFFLFSVCGFDFGVFLSKNKLFRGERGKKWQIFIAVYDKITNFAR
jgi:hypothetical protein